MGCLNYVGRGGLRAKAIEEKSLGTDHPSLATTLNNLAALYESQGRYAEAERLYLRTKAIVEKSLGANHPSLAATLNNLAGLYESQGRYVEAERLYLRTKAIVEKSLGADHPSLAATLNNLAGLYESQGRYAEAEPLYLRTKTIEEKSLGADHPSLATTLNNLAELYRMQGRYVEAEPLYLRAKAIDEKSLGADHPLLATTLNNLALLYELQGRYPEAERLYLRTKAIQEKSLGADHPSLAATLNNLAGLYRMQGRYDDAERLYLRTKAIQEKLLGADHPLLATTLNNLAGLHWLRGNVSSARKDFSASLSITARHLDNQLATGAGQHHSAKLRTLTGELHSHVTFSIAAPTAAAIPGIRSIYLLKGRALDATAATYTTLRANLNTKSRPQFDQWRSLQSQLATKTLRGPGNLPVAQHRANLAKLGKEAERLEATLSRHSAAFATARKPITVANVRAGLSPQQVLVEWVWYEPLNIRHKSENRKWQPAHYAAAILPHRGAPRLIDLGPAAAIDKLVAETRRAVSGRYSSAANLLRELDAKVMAPVREHLPADTTHLFLSPDAQLNLVPFGALIDEDGNYLIQRYSHSYLTSGRDLMRRSLKTTPRSGDVLVGSPTFGNLGVASLSFEPLVEEEQEVAAVKAKLRKPKVYTAGQATEKALRGLKGPRILHISTHGFFQEVKCGSQTKRGDKERSDKQPGNPLLRSGLAMAGANECRGGGKDDGLLTAMEATSLNLYGTKLVVLSACNTGTGETRAGEGVYGLRRALVLSGAETQVMSLWKVPAAATAAMMSEYYCYRSG